jgi:hypothetical protein
MMCVLEGEKVQPLYESEFQRVVSAVFTAQTFQELRSYNPVQI